MNPIFFDGAFGTYYISKTENTEPCELANLNDKSTVVSIHKEYITAGVNAIKTNTFAESDEEIISQGYKLALEAARGTDVNIYADIGPKADSAEYVKTVNTFINLGTVNFLFETLPGLDGLESALETIKKKVKNANIIVSFAVSRDGLTQNGQPFKAVISEAANNVNIDVVGLNCVCGPAHILELMRELGNLSKPLSIMPNSGYASIINGRSVYQNNIGYFAEKIVEINKVGASVLGGCCGTTPDHIAAAIKAVKLGTEPAKPKNISASPVISPPENKFVRKTIAVELSPPIDTGINFHMQAADKLKQVGVDIITLTDSPMSKARADSFMTASIIKREKNIDVLPHLTCRDKNFIAIKGALLGASFNGINKVLVISGDPVINAENYRNPNVFNFNSKKLIRYIKNLNDTVFAKREFSIGGAINVNAQNFDAELKRCKEKIENGADFLYSQPIFTNESIEHFKQASRVLNCKLFAGILPIVSYKNALFLNNELQGIDIPQNLVDKLKDKTPSETQKISVQFCHEIIKQIYDYADGFYIMTPMKKVDLVCGIIKNSFL